MRNTRTRRTNSVLRSDLAKEATAHVLRFSGELSQASAGTVGDVTIASRAMHTPKFVERHGIWNEATRGW